MDVFLIILSALILDYLIGEPKRFHPLVAFGYIASKVELFFNRSKFVKLFGVLALFLLVVPISGLIYFISNWLQQFDILQYLFAIFILYLVLGWRSLHLHALAVIEPLRESDLVNARKAVANLVSRDTQLLDNIGVAKAATESVLENGSDAVFATLFWFIVAGLPGVVLYRLSNTLDAMWGYKNSRFTEFGWAAARWDDLMNYIPARLTAISYALVAKKTRLAFKCWKQQAPQWSSPNAGPVMAAGAGALGVVLGGKAYYYGKLTWRPILGPNQFLGFYTVPKTVTVKTISAACQLVNRALILWLLVLFVIELMILAF